MNKTLLAIPILMLGAAAAAAAAAAAESTLIEVFADGPVDVPHVHNAHVVTYDVDIDERAQRLNPTFHGGSVREAQEKALEWRKSEGFNAFSRHMVEVYAPLQRVAELRLTRVPAVVFNETFVVYGTSDIGQAVSDYVNFTNQEQP